MGILILIIFPLFIWLFLYIGYVIACWFYNLVIPWTGGIEFEVVDSDILQENMAQTTSEDVVVQPDKIIEAPPEKNL